jgi:ATP-dependent Clp protease ATP-binding subunit ClpC
VADLYDFSGILDRLTDNARDSLEHANAIAKTAGSSYIGTEHLLMGLLSQQSSIGAKVLNAAGVTIDRAKLALRLTPKIIINQPSDKGLSEAAKLTLRMSWEIAQEFNQEYCGTEHILFSLLNQNNSRAYRLLNDMNISVNELKDELEHFLHSQQYDYESASGAATRRRQRGRGSLLEHFGSDLTALASKGELDPLIGREAQLERIVTVLARRQKNNPVLIGEPGVGKTAIVEGLAQRIVSESVPDSLLDKRLVTLDLAGMIAGTKYRGEFEERLKRVLREVTEDDNTIIFIDEVHLLVGAGAAEGAIDAGNILKPALARGKIRIIGATTTDEYHKHVENDAALERRFQPIVVPESSVGETVAILKGLKGHYEKFHGVRLSEDTLEAAARLAKRYITDRRLPDKAIDLIDEAAASVRIERGSVPAEQRRLQRMLKMANTRMEDAVVQEDYQRAAMQKTRIAQLTQRLNQVRMSNRDKSRMSVGIEDISKVVARTTGVPITKLQKPEIKYLLNLESHLKKHVIGQDEAIAQVAKSIRRNRSGVSDERRPIGSFIFLGPTGVGKTELARVIARELFHDEASLIKIDMSELSERHTVARLVGAPAGYVGYDDGGQLTDRVRRHPYSVVLFDEIEKAHPEVFNILLQILEDGQLTDAKGRRVDFSNTVVVMTSNVGAPLLQKEANFGFNVASGSDESKLDDMHDETSNRVLDELRHLMRPELLNRIDKAIVFRALTRKDARAILELQLEQLAKRLGPKKVSIQLSSAAKRRLLDIGYDAANGVRPLRRAIQDEIEDHLAHGLLAELYKAGDIIEIGTSKKKDFSFALARE